MIRTFIEPVPFRCARRTLYGAALALTFFARPGEAATQYSDRLMFESTLGATVTDDYESVGYQSGDVHDEVDADTFSNAAMNAVFGEAQYTTTGFTDWNLILERDGGRHYCAGCNGSYELGFTATSVGTSNGVFGIGLDVADSEQDVYGTTAFVTYGNGSTENLPIPDVDAFWGITSPDLIAKIHFGLLDGGVNTDDSLQRMAMDNLTFGSARVPEPDAVVCALAAVAGIAVWQGRRQRR